MHKKIEGWFFKKFDVISIQGGYEEMLKFTDKVGGWVGGVQKGQKHADIIYGWSLM